MRRLVFFVAYLSWPSGLAFRPTDQRGYSGRVLVEIESAVSATRKNQDLTPARRRASIPSP